MVKNVVIYGLSLYLLRSSSCARIKPTTPQRWGSSLLRRVIALRRTLSTASTASLPEKPSAICITIQSPRC